MHYGNDGLEPLVDGIHVSCNYVQARTKPIPVHVVVIPKIDDVIPTLNTSES